MTDSFLLTCLSERSELVSFRFRQPSGAIAIMRSVHLRYLEDASPVLFDYASNALASQKPAGLPSTLLPGFDAFQSWLYTGGYSNKVTTNDTGPSLHLSFHALIFGVLFDIGHFQALAIHHLDRLLASTASRYANSPIRLTPSLVLNVLGMLRGLEDRWVPKSIVDEAITELEDALGGIMVKVVRDHGFYDPTVSWRSVWVQYPRLKEIVSCT